MTDAAQNGPPGADAVAASAPGRRWPTLDMRALSPFIALAALLVLGALVSPQFLDPSNLLNVVTRSAFIAIIAIGATFVIAGGGLDLSVGSMAALVAGVMILTLNGSGSGVETLALGMAVALGSARSAASSTASSPPSDASSPSS